MCLPLFLLLQLILFFCLDFLRSVLLIYTHEHQHLEAHHLCCVEDNIRTADSFPTASILHDWKDLCAPVTLEETILLLAEALAKLALSADISAQFVD
jgi:hypothetical protein